MTKEEKLLLIQEAREFGCKSVTIEGVVYELGKALPTNEPINEEALGEAVKNMSVLDEYSQDEILYYSSPYFEELQEQKELKAKQLQERNDG